MSKSSPLLLIRAPHPEETSNIGRRFPHLVAEGDSAEFLIAERTDSPGTMAGWIALKYFPNKHKSDKAKFLFHVNQHFRRQGIGSALLDKAIETARKNGAQKLTHMRPILSGSVGENFIKAKNFVQTSNFMTYELETNKVLAVIEPIFKKLLQKNKLPRQQYLYYVENIVNKPDLSHFVRKNLNQLSNSLKQRIDNNFASFTQSSSPVIIYNNEIVGLALTTIKDTQATIDAKIVAKSYHHTWVNVVLKYELARSLSFLGVTRFKFGTYAKLCSDSNHLLTKTNAQLLLNQSQYELAL